MNDLLKEAIADAKAVREVALANAKLALEEAFTPKLQSMLSKKLAEEAEYEGDDEMDSESPEADTSVKEEGDSDEYSMEEAENEDEMDIDEFFGEAEGSEEDSEEGSGEADLEERIHQLEQSLAKLEGKDSDEEPMEEAEESEDYSDEEDIDEDLMEIIRQLEEDIDSSGIGTGDNKKPSPVASDDSTEDKKEKLVQLVNEEDDEKTDDIDEMIRSIREEDEESKEKMDEAEDDDETVDIKEILRALREEEEESKEKVDEGEDEEKEKEVSEAKLREAYAVITFLRSKINEVNLLNSKLLFSNKIFKKYSLTENQKYTVIENFDRASSLREVKLVYATLCEAIKSTKSNIKPIKESFASKPIASTRPKNIINEGDNMADRLRHLAGLK
jgi:hypothetical protein